MKIRDLEKDDFFVLFSSEFLLQKSRSNIFDKQRNKTKLIKLVSVHKDTVRMSKHFFSDFNEIRQRKKGTQIVFS